MSPLRAMTDPAVTDPPAHQGRLRSDLLAQTAQIPFAELQRVFAAGRLLLVDESMDLIEMAVSLVEDDRSRYADWVAAGKICAVNDAQATRWLADAKLLWAVVADPWVLVQERQEQTGQ
ncbi:MAG: hypothetical protein ACI87W_001064 [Halieaceae bacterium]|jgi:hypothetical protein